MRPTKEHIERLARSEPTWLSCANLQSLVQDDELGRMMGALASAMRSGSEITFEDWGYDWFATAVFHLPTMNKCTGMVENRHFARLNQWLEENEETLIAEIHEAYIKSLRASLRVEGQSEEKA